MVESLGGVVEGEEVGVEVLVVGAEEVLFEAVEGLGEVPGVGGGVEVDEVEEEGIGEVAEDSG